MGHPGMGNISGNNNLQSFKSAKLLPDSQEVQQGLGRMIATAVTPVDDGNRNITEQIFIEIILTMADNYGINILGEGLYRIIKAFPLQHAGGLFSKGKHLAAQAALSSFKGIAGPGTGFEKEIGYQLITQISPFPLHEFFRNIKDFGNLSNT